VRSLRRLRRPSRVAGILSGIRSTRTKRRRAPIKEATAIAMAVAVVNVQTLLRLRMVCLPFGA